MSNNRPPWNKGKKGIEAGWTPERRAHQSRLQREYIKRHPIPRRLSTIVGPDPEVQRHYYRWLRARAQARFWRQEWSILWEDYLDIYKTAPGKWGGRDGAALHLARIDTAEGWHLWNVHLVNRGESMRRSTKGKRRIKPAGLGSKARGINWRKKRDDTRTED
jgi:hypothetical protein